MQLVAEDYLSRMWGNMVWYTWAGFMHLLYQLHGIRELINKQQLHSETRDGSKKLYINSDTISLSL